MWSKRIASKMKDLIQQYEDIFSLDTKKKDISKQITERYFLYLFVKALIEMKLIFDMKSTRKSECLDESIQFIIGHFEKIIGQKLEIDAKNIKRKLWANTQNDDNPIDLAYKNATLEDMDQWENYLDTSYFIDK